VDSGPCRSDPEPRNPRRSAAGFSCARPDATNTQHARNSLTRRTSRQNVATHWHGTCTLNGQACTQRQFIGAPGKCEPVHERLRSAMTLPSLDILLLAGRAVFLLFSFICAAIAFTAWRRATQTQTQQVLEHTRLVLERLARIEARVDATKLCVSELGERVDRPQQPPQ